MQHDISRVAVVTGGSRGIGRAVARRLAARGDRVVVNFRSDRDAAAETIAMIESDGGVATAVQADVCDAGQAAGLVGSAVEAYGRIDALVCNANVGLVTGTIAGIGWESFIGKIDTELAAAFHPTQAALPLMTGQGYGRLVYLSAEAAKGPAGADVVAHGAAKAALTVYAKFTAREGAPHGVVANVVSPGLTRTDATSGIPPEWFRQFAERIPVGRAADPEDVAKVVAFFASEDAGYVAGTVTSVNGGSTMLG